ATAAELRHARGAMPGTAGSLLRVHFLAGPPDFATALRLMSSALTLGELPIDTALDDVCARLEAKDRIRQCGLSGVLAVESDDLDLHHSPSFFFFAAAAALSAAFGALSAALSAALAAWLAAFAA